MHFLVLSGLIYGCFSLLSTGCFALRSNGAGAFVSLFVYVLSLFALLSASIVPADLLSTPINQDSTTAKTLSVLYLLTCTQH